MNILFNPKTIALIGATNRTGSVGLGLAKNLLSTSAHRKIFLVNPNHKTLFSQKVYPSILSIDSPIDLSVIAIPAKFVLQAVKESIKKKVRGMIIISAGFAESGALGVKRQRELANLVNKAKIPLVGPNCLGIIDTHSKLNASFSPTMPQTGNISLISQSGALIDSILDIGRHRFGFRRVISLGNEASNDLSDFLEFLGNDLKTKVILLYLEGVKNGTKLMKTVKKITKKKPILVLKAGRTKAGKKAVKSHTALLAGDDIVFQTACRQSGIILTETLEELMNLAKTLSWQPRIKRGSLGIITNGGGLGVLASDYCRKFKIKLAQLSPTVLQKLIKSNKINPAFSQHNPLDLIGDALAEQYELAINFWMKQKDLSGLVIILSPQIMTQAQKTAKIIVQAKKRFVQKPIITVFSGKTNVQSAIKILEENQIPNFIDPYWAILGMKYLLDF